ncbi:MAG: hypothetical protein JW941_10605, partial [Candidatus Coatesbacteria bacterium]|nr:hypothetical protein [Candidatus Coatesbacteria bacterium]
HRLDQFEGSVLGSGPVNAVFHNIIRPRNVISREFPSEGDAAAGIIRRIIGRDAFDRSRRRIIAEGDLPPIAIGDRYAYEKKTDAED